MKIYIQGFKSLRDGQYVALGKKLTFLVGPNSAGKSAVALALNKIAGDSIDFELDQSLIYINPNNKSTSVNHTLGLEWSNSVGLNYGQFLTYIKLGVDDDNKYYENLAAIDLIEIHKKNILSTDVNKSSRKSKFFDGSEKIYEKRTAYYFQNEIRFSDVEYIITPEAKKLLKSMGYSHNDMKENNSDKVQDWNGNFESYININKSKKILLPIMQYLESVIEKFSKIEKFNDNEILFEDLKINFTKLSILNFILWNNGSLERQIKKAFTGKERQTALNLCEKMNSIIIRYKSSQISLCKYPGISLEPRVVSAERLLPQKNDTHVMLDFLNSNRISRDIDYQNPFHALMYSEFDHSNLIELVNKALSENLFVDNGYQIKINSFSLGDHENNEYFERERYWCEMSLFDSHGRNLKFEDVGSGIGYVLPVLIESFRPSNKDKVVFIQQPELHLHPALQAELTDVFIEAAKDRRIVAETHSEYLILRALKRIRQTTNGTISDPALKLTPEDVAVNYFEPQADGSTKVHILRISDDGDFLDRWPKGFFAERDLELFDE